MKYSYPYKEWLGGLIFFIIITIYGVFLIYDIQPTWFYWIGYLALCYLLIDWYWSKFILYKSKHISITNSYMEFSFNHNRNKKRYIAEEIEYIINSNHKQRLKTHNVTHFFMKNGDYYYLTREINNYERLKKDLKKRFPNKYFAVKDSFYGVLEEDKKSIILEKLKNS
ncbi:hypothetical protein [Alkaliphilus serpentinus]|uniref:Uncharacterized protein n=1 Tax=Alkaliphilus serpentinus TaxID=1482731 RepID=A0A833HLB5_9FIRM|nr:hypothetical protein [Alkaliphilus serpentinus]KAB3525617.1 hypothetical protein F8153_15105 [Alkaliphilus serpentinus]